MPSSEKTVSTTMTPPSRFPKLSATSVTSGMRALRNACFIVTRLLCETLRTRRAHVVRVQDLEHRGTDVPRVAGDAGDHQHEDGQHEVMGPIEREVDPAAGIDRAQARDREHPVPVCA